MNATHLNPGTAHAGNSAYVLGTDRRVLVQFAWILGVFSAIYLFCWPVVFSLDLWILKDRSSFLNLDNLLSEHMRLGVDTFYSYGLLPVAIQHWLFALFGSGYLPLLGCAIATMILIALFCALYLRFLPREWVWMASILVMARMVNIVNPNLPYELVQLSLLFALLCVLAGRLDLGLAAAAVGCWSVPSLPLVMAVSLTLLIVLDWFLKPSRSAQGLILALAPGIGTYLGLGVLMAIEFGWSSAVATATPLAGMRFYRQVNFGTGHALLEFLHPAGHSLLYYVTYSLFTPVIWWVFCTVSLTIFGLMAVRRMALQRALDPQDTAIALAALIHVMFVCVAYGSPHQHFIFDPILIIGTLLGLSALPATRMRSLLVIGFLVFGVAGQANLVRADVKAWKEIKSPGATANLYADSKWIKEWREILELSNHQNLLLFSYGTGVHHYFPSVHSPDAWTMQEGQLLPEDKARVLRQMDEANVVALDLTSPTTLVERDTDIQGHLQSLCLTQSTDNFQVWKRLASGATDARCMENPRRFYGK